MGDIVLAHGLVPSHVLCSPARRARETWDILATRLTGDKPATDHDERLYAADATTYLDIVRAMTADGPLLVVGHNPMLEDVAHIFAARGSKEARAGLAGGFPPCAMAVIAIDGDFAETTPATSELNVGLSITLLSLSPVVASHRKPYQRGLTRRVQFFRRSFRECCGRRTGPVQYRWISW